MNVYYAKTALYAYANLEAIMEQIDELVEKKALSSMSDYSSALEQCESILNYTAQKDVLIDLKLHIDEALTKLKDENLDYLDYKYFKQKPKDYYVDFDFESRNYFRKQKKLATRVARLLEAGGATDEWFEKNCLKIDFFFELYKRTLAHEKSYSKKAKIKKNKPQTVKNLQKLSA